MYKELNFIPIHYGSSCKYSSTYHIFRLHFHTYLPDVIRDANDDVETHIVEPMEPPDVRKSRQLTLDNMKLHRELEKMKQGMCVYKKTRQGIRDTLFKIFLHNMKKI